MKNKIKSVRTVTSDELSLHKNADECWIQIEGNVYDITKYLPNHPGGIAPVSYAGKDATKIFNKIHPKGVLEQIAKQFLVGKIEHVQQTKKEHVQTKNKKLIQKVNQNLYFKIPQKGNEDIDGYDLRKNNDKSRQFGELMAREDQTSNIPFIIIFMYLTLALYSYITHLVTGCSIWTIFMYYLAAMIAFYLWHYIAHSEWSGQMNQIHMEHHLERYPPSNFYGSSQLYKQQYPNGKPTIWSLMNLFKTTNLADGTKFQASDKVKHTPLAHEGPLLIMLLIIIFAGVYIFGTKWSTMGFIFVMFFVVSSVGNALHMSFHVRNFHLEKYEWYMELRTLHYIHHLGDMKSNLGMLNLVLIDGVTGSLQTTDPTKKHFIESSIFKRTKTLQNKDLPEGIKQENICRVASHAGFTATALGLDVPLDIIAINDARKQEGKRGHPTVLLRIMLMIFILYCYFSAIKWNQNWIQNHSDHLIVSDFDKGHNFFIPFRNWLIADDQRVIIACCISAILSEIIGVVVVLVSLFGDTFRPMLAMFVTLISRMIIQYLGALRVIAQVQSNIWKLPENWPTIFVEDKTANLFFSARISVAIVACMELLSISFYDNKYYRKNRSLNTRIFTAILAIIIIVCQVSITLALQTSWSFDVFTSLIIARYATIVSERSKHFFDAFMP